MVAGAGVVYEKITEEERKKDTKRGATKCFGFPGRAFARVPFNLCLLLFRNVVFDDGGLVHMTAEKSNSRFFPKRQRNQTPSSITNEKDIKNLKVTLT
jgi:hypothetical protein